MVDKYTGKRLDARYEIQELIGVGGMAVVYKAYDTIDHRTVAIKILKDEFSGNAEFLRRFKNESKAIAVLDHPNIVKVYNVSFGDRIQYIVMEYIDGISLKEYLLQQKEVKWKEAIHFTVQILRALQHAHEKGIVHRDIKPQNIMLLQDGSIKVTDFGIARFSHSETRTMTDKAIGSVHYIAPEQARGDLTDEKADIYSVGVMMYEMLTGQLPFEADNAVSVAIMQLQADPKPPRELNPALPEGLEEITLKAMQKNPSQRYQSAAEMLRDIEQFRRNPNITFHYQYFTDENSKKYDSVHAGNGTGEFDLTQRSSQRGRYYPPEEPPVQYDDNYDSYAPYPEESRSSRARKISTGAIIGICVAAALLLAGAGVGISALLGAFDGGDTSSAVQEDVYLSNFVGQQIEDVMAQLEGEEYQNLDIQIQYETNTEQEAGVVLRQTPEGNLNVKYNATVTFIVNQGSELIPIPDLRGQTEENARQMLTDRNLVPEVVEVNDDEVQEGYVVRSEPEYGSQVEENSTVRIYVSKGPNEEGATVPAIIADDLETAKAKIIEAGLQVGTTTPRDDSGLAQNQVIECSPAPGSKVAKNTVVNIVYSSGKSSTKTGEVTVTLPSGVNRDITLKAYVDGALTDQQTVNPSLNGTYRISVEGITGTKRLTVTLDDQPYSEYSIDFDNNASVVQTASYTYNPGTVSTPSSPDPDEGMFGDVTPG